MIVVYVRRFSSYDKNTIYFEKYKANTPFYISHNFVFTSENQGPEHIS